LEKEEKGESGEEGLREENKKLSSDVKYLELRVRLALFLSSGHSYES